MFGRYLFIYLHINLYIYIFYLDIYLYLFLSKDDEFLINSFKVNIDTNDINHTFYDKANDSLELDVGQGEIKYISENLNSSESALRNEEIKLKEIYNYLDSKNHIDWKQTTPYLLTFHVNYKEDVFNVDEFEIATTYNLALVQDDDSTLQHQNSIFKQQVLVLETSQ